MHYPNPNRPWVQLSVGSVQWAAMSWMVFVDEMVKPHEKILKLIHMGQFVQTYLKTMSLSCQLVSSEKNISWCNLSFL